MSIIIGADPGKTGALAMIDGDKLIDALRIPYSKPTPRAWVVGGKHKETKFVVPTIESISMRRWVLVGLNDYSLANAWVYIEEPSSGKGKSSGVDASINRAFQALHQTFWATDQKLLVSPRHWQAQLFKVVPRAIESTELGELGIPGNNTPLNTKQRARLACLFQWGVDECVAKLKHTPRSSQLDSGRCDAACLALFGLLHQGITPRLLAQPMHLHLRELGIR